MSINLRSILDSVRTSSVMELHSPQIDKHVNATVRWTCSDDHWRGWQSSVHISSFNQRHLWAGTR